MVGTRTPNLDLYKPLFDEEGWDDEINENFDTIDTEVAAKAPRASPVLTGEPTAPTAEPGTNTTQIATTAFTKAAVDAKPLTGAYIRRTILTSESGNFTTDAKTHTLRITLIGGGGGTYSSMGPSSYYVFPGQAGGYCEKIVACNPSTPYAYVVGAAGTGGVFNVGQDTVSQPGTDGTDTTLIIGATTYKGSKGVCGAAADSNTILYTDRTSAVGVNGDFNYTKSMRVFHGYRATAVFGEGEYGCGGIGTVSQRANGSAGKPGIIIIEEFA